MQLCYKIIKLIFFILMYHCTKQIFSDNEGANFFLQGYVVYCHKYHKKKSIFLYYQLETISLKSLNC